VIPPHKAQMIICSKHFGGHGPYVPSDYAHACRQKRTWVNCKHHC